MQNDLLAGNFIDDGARVWLIDYEYSGNNEASFELGNIWSESTLPDDLLELLTMSYWGEYSAAKIARARLWALMSKYGWTLWASIQQSVSPIEFDYWSWHGEVRAGGRGVRRSQSRHLVRRRDAVRDAVMRGR